jgi:TatD DNase family protein
VGRSVSPRDKRAVGKSVPPVSVTAFADSHVHLASTAFTEDVDAVIDRARAAGARALVCIGESPAAAVRARDIALRFPGLVHHTCGLHPHDAADWDDVVHPAAIRDAVRLGAVAVGECGLDYHYDHSPRDVQRRALEAQLALAAELDRPIVLHTREAEDDTRDLLRSAASAGVRGVLHCFTGSRSLAQAGLDAGWYVSFSGIISFRNWHDESLLALVPDDRLLVESDAPYLAPIPHRGKRNESSWVPHTIQRLAAARGTTAEALAALTLDNTQSFFRLPVA